MHILRLPWGWSKARAALVGLAAALGILALPTASLATATPCPRVLAQVFDVGTSTVFRHTFSGWATTGPSSCAYTSLRLVGQVRDSNTGSQQEFYGIQFGTGGGALDQNGLDYSAVVWQIAPTGGSSLTTGGDPFEDYMLAGFMPSSGFPAVYAGSFSILLPNAFSSDFDGMIIANSATRFGGDSDFHAGRWAASGPLTSFGITLLSGQPWADHTIFYLYEN